MSSPEPALVVIACPHCGTRYEVARSAIGARGREVQCAHCAKSWQAHAEPAVAPPAETPPLDAGAERALDDKFAAEERKAAPRGATRAAPGKTGEAKAPDAGSATTGKQPETPAKADEEAWDRVGHKARVAPRAEDGETAPGLDTRVWNTQQRAFSRRLALTNSRLPVARLRRSARIVGVGALIVLIGGGLMMRNDVVAQFPSLAGLYGALGLPVNVVGLEFRNVHTLKSLQQGVDVLAVHADIFSVSNGNVRVPPVIVTLMSGAGKPVYQWSVTAKAADLEPGEVVGLDTQITSPPSGADRVRLTFASLGSQPGLPPVPPGPPAAAEPKVSGPSP